jgi:hypothetical protein
MKLSFAAVKALAAHGAKIDSCAGVELDGEHIGYPADEVSSEYTKGPVCPTTGLTVRNARCVFNDETKEEVWLPMNYTTKEVN